MTNQEIARIFEKTAFFLALKDDNEFKINAYAKAAKSIRDYPSSVEDMLLAGEDLTGIDGVGKILSQKIEELIVIGSLKVLNELLADFPESLYEMSQIRGIGPKTILKLYQAHRIHSLEELQRFLQSGEKLALPATYECRIKEFFRK